MSAGAGIAIAGIWLGVGIIGLGTHGDAAPMAALFALAASMTVAAASS